MRRDFLQHIQNGELLIGDGAMGTLLLERGLKPGEPPESFNLENLEILKEIAGLYLEAGADIIQTNTFGASPLKLSFYNLEDRVREINRNAVLAVREVVGDNAYVSGSCGPTGKILKPYGDTDKKKVRDSFKVQISELVDSGVDTICIETMTDINEITIAVETAKEIKSDIPIIATMTFDSTPKGFFTVMGVDIENATTMLEEAGADIIGSNCGNGIENMIKIAHEFKKLSDLPLIIQSNAGLPEMLDNKTVYPETPEFMAEKAEKLVRIGVSIIGGCCGTTPEHIRSLRYMVDSFSL